MVYIIIALCICYSGIQLFKGEKIYRPSVLFSIVWATILIMYSLELYGLPRISNDTYLIILYGILAIFSGAVIAGISKKKIIIGNKNLFEKEINPVIFNFLNILFFIIMIIPLIKALKLLLGGTNLYTIRYLQQQNIIGDGLIAILFNYFCEPYLVFLIVYSVANIFSKNKNKNNIIITLIGVVFISVITGGRFFILYFISALSIGLLVYKKYIKINRIYNDKRLNRKVKILIILSVILIISVSIVRGSVLSQNIYVYLCGGVPYLEYLKNTIAVEGHTYGSAITYGFSRPLFVVLRKFTMINLPEWLQNTERIFLAIDEPYYIANRQIFNSFSTCFFAPYLDLGYCGVFIFFFIFGYISERLYKRVDLKNEYLVSCFFLVSLMIVLSFFRLLITHYSFALAFIYLFITHKKTKLVAE